MERAGMQEYFGQVRAFFAPVNRTTETGMVFDPAAAFDLNNPPAPWVSLGLVRNFKTHCEVHRRGSKDWTGGNCSSAVP